MRQSPLSLRSERVPKIRDVSAVHRGQAAANVPPEARRHSPVSRSSRSHPRAVCGRCGGQADEVARLPVRHFVFRSATLMSAFGTNQTSQRHRLMSAFEFREAPRRSTNADADCETFTILSCSGLTFFGIK